MLDYQSEDSYQFEFEIIPESANQLKEDAAEFLPEDIEQHTRQHNFHAFSTRGSRDYNYDEFDFVYDENFVMGAVYDGHGDGTVAHYLRNNLLKNIVQKQQFGSNPAKAIRESLQQMQEYCCRTMKPNSGSTALIVLCIPSGILVVNVGNSVCLGSKCTQVYQKNKSNSIPKAIIKEEFLTLNTSHSLKNMEERRNVEGRGGLIMRRGGCDRLFGDLNLSRAIGSNSYKRWISAEADIYYYPNNIKNIILCSDGVESISCQRCPPLQLLQMMKSSEPSDNATLLSFTNPFFQISK